jgi:hypothetical protein
MIIQEQISDTLVRTYSDANMYIRGGNPVGDYAEAIDPIVLNRTYTETDIPIVDDEVTEEEYAEVGRIFMGVKP